MAKTRVVVVDDSALVRSLLTEIINREPDMQCVGAAADPLKSGTEEFKNEEIRVWSADGEVLIASITAKLHLISPAVTEGLVKAVEIAEAKYKGLVIWSPDDVFSAGANLEALMPVFMKSGGKGIAPASFSAASKSSPPRLNSSRRSVSDFSATVADN